MADANEEKIPKRWRLLILLGLALLSACLAWLTYREVVFLVHAWRWRHNVLVELRIVFQILLLLMLTIGAGIGPLAFLWRRLRKPTRE